MIHLICGNDDFLVVQRAQALVESKKQPVEKISGNVNTFAEVDLILKKIFAKSLQLDLWDWNKIIWLDQINFLGDTILGKAERTKEALAKWQKNLEEHLQIDLLLTAVPIDRRTKAFKWFIQHGQVEFLENTGKATAEKLLQDALDRFGLTMDTSTKEIFLELVGNNLRILWSEVEKLAIYYGNTLHKVSLSTIYTLTATGTDSPFFEVLDAFYSKNQEWTKRALEHFFKTGESRSLLSAFQNRNRLMLQLKHLQDEGQIKGQFLTKGRLEAIAQFFLKHFPETPEKTSFYLFSQNPWYLNSLLKQSSAFSTQTLLEFQTQLLDLFLKLIEHPKLESRLWENLLMEVLHS